MASQSPLVDAVRDIQHQRKQGGTRAGKAAQEAIVVHFAGGGSGLLDPASARDRTWNEVLESLHESGQPAYVELDPDTGHISSLLLPEDFTVAAIRTTPEGDLELDLMISAARHYLRRDHPHFDQVRRTLEKARRAKAHLLVTESLDGSAIVDVRPVPTGRSRRRPKR
jgi:hypothetical protein